MLIIKKHISTFSDMSKLLNSILQSLTASNYLTGKCVVHNEKFHCHSSLLKNGLTFREQLLKQWLLFSTSWSSQWGGIKQIKEHFIENDRISFVHGNKFQKSFVDVCKEYLINISNSVMLKSICNNVHHNFGNEDNLFFGTKIKVLLVTDFFVAAENALTQYNNLQRERKIWWMRFSFDPSRYQVDTYKIPFKEQPGDEIFKKSKSITITAKFPFGLVDMENISLVPLYKSNILKCPLSKDSCKISLIRSVINLDSTASALILDASVPKTKNRNYTLMINGKLAPYQIVLSNLHQGNTTVDELTLHLKNVITKSGLRLYDNFIRTNTRIEYEEKLWHFDSLGIPYTLLVDNESIKSGLIKMRSRETSLFETIHISDIPSYLLHVFKQ